MQDDFVRQYKHIVGHAMATDVDIPNNCAASFALGAWWPMGSLLAGSDQDVANLETIGGTGEVVGNEHSVEV